MTDTWQMIIEYPLCDIWNWYVSNWPTWTTGYVYTSSYHPHLIGSINLFPYCCHILLRLCVWQSFHMDPRKARSLFPLILYNIRCVRICLHYAPKVVFASLHITPSQNNHYAELSESIAYIYSVEFVWDYVPQLYFIYYMHMVFCVIGVPIPVLKIVRILTPFRCHHQLANTSHWPLFRVMSGNNSMRRVACYFC